MRQLGSRVIGWILGGRAGENISSALAKVGLRGLGAAVHYDVRDSGEMWFFSRVMKYLPNASCIDVGANVGDYSMMLRRLGAGPILAIEPVPTTFARLKNSLGTTQGVELLQCAVGEQDGEISLFVPASEQDSTLVTRDLAAAGIADRTTTEVRVPMRSLDSIVADRGRPTDLLKIDVEGFELEVLQGAEDLLANSPPKVIQFEFNIHHLRRHHNLCDFADVLQGYDLYRLSSRSIRKLDLDHYLSHIYVYQNIIAIHGSFRQTMEI